VADCLVEWGNEKQVGRKTKAEHKAGKGLEAGWEFVSQRAPIPYRAFLIEVGAWTAFFDNHLQEFLPQAELFVLCDRLDVDTCFFGFAEDACWAHFCYFRKENGKVRERQVMLYDEGGWVFSAQGDPLPFENLADYQRTSKKDRLTQAMLQSYAAHLAVPLSDAAQFGHDICFLQWQNFNKRKRPTQREIAQGIAILPAGSGEARVYVGRRSAAGLVHRLKSFFQRKRQDP
jgi:hypothetical protein